MSSLVAQIPLPPQQPFWLDLLNGFSGLVMLAGFTMIVFWVFDARGAAVAANNSAGEHGSTYDIEHMTLPEWHTPMREFLHRSGMVTTTTGFTKPSVAAAAKPSTSLLVGGILMLTIGFSGLGYVLYRTHQTRRSYNVWRFQRLSVQERMILASMRDNDNDDQTTNGSKVRNLGLSVGSFGTRVFGNNSV